MGDARWCALDREFWRCDWGSEIECAQDAVRGREGWAERVPTRRANDVPTRGRQQGIRNGSAVDQVKDLPAESLTHALEHFLAVGRL